MEVGYHDLNIYENNYKIVLVLVYKVVFNKQYAKRTSLNDLSIGYKKNPFKVFLMNVFI